MRKKFTLTQYQIHQLINTPLKERSKLVGLRNRIILELLLSGLKPAEILTLIKSRPDNKSHCKAQAMYYIKEYINLRRDNNPWLIIQHDNAKQEQNRALSLRSLQREVSRYGKMAGLSWKLTPSFLYRNLKIL